MSNASSQSKVNYSYLIEQLNNKITLKLEEEKLI